MRIVFMGTPDFAVPSLDALLEAGHDVLAVVTQPDKPVGRRRVLTPPPLKTAALERGLPVLQPERAKDESFLAQMRALAPDLVAYAAYGKILPPSFLEIPKHGCINVHASLLPKYRGAAPIQWAIINGETVTGVSIMRAEVGLDTGPVLLQRELPIGPDETAGELSARLAQLGAEMLVEAVELIETGKAVYTPQDDSLATYAPTLKPEDAVLDWYQPAENVRNRVRALNPKPGAVTVVRGREVKVWKAQVVEGDHEAEPGTVVAVLREALVVQALDAGVLLEEVQPAGGKKMSGGDLARGWRIGAGEILAGGMAPT
ncbi:MAG: methionyl-tRNA formyltransferase [Armatimonadota bacterium]